MSRGGRRVDMWLTQRSPYTGTEPGNKVCDGAGEGGSLTDATIKGGCACTKRGGGDDGDICEGLSNPFGVAKGRETKDSKGE